MSTQIEVGDIRGDLVSVGDKIAYAVRQGDTAALTVGTIVEILPAKAGLSFGSRIPTKLRVQGEYRSGYSDAPSKPVLIDASLKRFVKVGE